MNQGEIFKKTQKLDVIDILMSVEDEFKIEVPDEDAENVKTVEQMVEYVKDKLK